MTAQWKDVSTYSRFDKERKPWAWEIKLGSWRLTVVYNHRDYLGQYIYYIPGVVDNTLLKFAFTELDAKMQALEAARTLAARIVAAAEEVVNGR